MEHRTEKQSTEHKTQNMKHRRQSTEHRACTVGQWKMLRAPCSVPRGFTVLFAVLMSSLLLAIGISIFNISMKERVLASASKESQNAFYAADSGVECALYWDIRDDAFNFTDPGSDTIDCHRDMASDSRNSSNRFTVGVSGVPVSTFTIRFYPSDACAVVTVTKTPTPGATTIVSEGYNTCDDANPRRVERTIRVSYEDAT
ncbi:MAG: hypothetical protein G01um101472_460 [Parcubacteria group bacterium Gr01-1014_72]|nr:MAG: hypothetical protein G01um101472_460 [Parcubacteria group bacterium Gr01-1014_72]